MKSQNRGPANGLTSVVAASPTEVWAVGHRDGFNRAGSAVWRTLVERWDGNEWSIVNSPNDSPHDNHLTGVEVGGPRKVWAVGGDGGTLVERIQR